MNKYLMQEWDTAYHAFPFDQVQQEDYEPTILALLEEAQKEINQIASNQEAADFFNTIEAMEKAGKQLNRVVEAFFNINSAETNDYIQEVAQKLAPALAKHSNDILLNETLFQRVKTVYEQSEQLSLNAEQKRLCTETYKGFVRNGALVQEADKEKLRAIDEKLSILRVQFSQNVLTETNAFQMHLENEEDVAGLPETALHAASEEAQKLNKSGYIFTLQFPSYIPFMKHAQNRALRQKLYMAYSTRGNQDNEYNNEAIIKEIVQLKNERARLLGYQHYAAFVLEERMAKNTETVNHFLQELLDKALPFAQKETVALKELAVKDGIDELMPYDHAYYAERLREAKYDYSEEVVKAYFPLEKVLEAAFNLANKLFGLTFTPTEKVAAYHPEVKVYEVQQNGQYKALLYTDFHPRPGKRPGAWMTSFRGQYKDENGNHRPHISIVCNFSRPTGDKPALLTFNEVTTLFHEFGHALHGMMADTQYESLSGTNVYWDFVELPSQFLENFCYAKEFLSTFAQHWKDGTDLDEAIIDKLIAAANFMEAYQTLRQLSFGMLDMAYHSGADIQNEKLSEFEHRIMEATRTYPVIKETCMSTSFGHIFGGGYAAGYYSYKWAEVLDADAFAYFKENGIFNPEIAKKYEHLLSSGGTVDPMELYIQFRGRAPEVDALLERAGLKG